MLFKIYNTYCSIYLKLEKESILILMFSSNKTCFKWKSKCIYLQIDVKSNLKLTKDINLYLLGNDIKYNIISKVSELAYEF